MGERGPDVGSLTEEVEMEMEDRGLEVRTFLASRLAGKGKERFVDLAVERLSSQAIEFVAELKDFSYADLARWGVPELLVKELQVFLKPPLDAPPVFAAPHFKATDVEGLLSGFWQELIGSLDGMANANEFKADHPFCKVSVCQVQGRPSLLWQGLEVHHYGASTKIYDLIARDKPALCILLGVSGAGKTRALYEIAVKRRCMFLTGMPPDRPLMEGSRDLLAVASTLERLYPEGLIPEIALQCCLKALFVVRFFIMQKSETFFNPLSNLTWLFKQVMHRQLRYIRPDPWHFLTNGILNLIKEPEHVQAMDTILTRMLHKDAAAWDGFIMLDECQEVDQYLRDRFTSPTPAGSDKRRSLLDKFVIALQDSGFTRATFIYAGTGRSLFHVASHVSETLKNRIDVCWFTSFGSFTDDKALRGFADNILVDTKGIDFVRLSQLYCGRYRFFVTALERYIENYRTDLDITNYLVQFAKDISTKRGTDVGMNRTVLDDVIRFFEKGVPSDDLFKARKLVEDVVVMHFYGRGKMVVVNPSLSLVEFGLARVISSQDQLEEGTVQWLEDGKPTALGLHCDGKMQYVEIGETVVCMACWHYFKSCQRMPQIQKEVFGSQVEGSHSRLGEVYEVAVAEMVGSFFNNRAPQDMLSSWYNRVVPKVYTQTCRLVVPAMQGTKLVGHVTENYRLLDWIEEVESEADIFPTFLCTGGDHTCGPDIIFFLEVYLDGMRILLPVLLQVNTLTKMGESQMRKAFYTLDLQKLFLHKKLGKSGFKKRVKSPVDHKGAERLRELATHGCLKIVVSTETLNLQSSLETQYKLQENERKPPKATRSACKRQKIKAAFTCVEPLLGVVDGTNITGFVDSWLVEAYKACKQAI